MFFYLESFIAAFCFSTLFATGGVGSAIVLIPVLSMMGVGFDLSKAAGLMVNTITTGTASIINYRRGLLDVKATIPFLFTSAISAPVGAHYAQRVDTQYIKMLFVGFLFVSVYLMTRRKTKVYPDSHGHALIMYPLGVSVGFLAGLLGIGGSALIIPALFYLQYPPGKIISTVSFMIPWSTFAAFLSYAWLISIDWLLITVISLAAVLGGNAGTFIMHKYLKDIQMKNVLAGILFLIGMKMFFEIIHP